MKPNYEKRLHEGKQLTLYESEELDQRKEKLKQWHMISRALLYSGLPINKADGYIGKVFCKYCPATRTMS